MISLYTDGSITGGPWASKKVAPSLPHAWSGYVAYLDSELLHFDSIDLGESPIFSGNVAEHFAVGAALWWLHADHVDHLVNVHTDSQLIVGHLTGNYNVHNEHLAILVRRTKALERYFPAVHYHWIPREQNREADHISKCLQTKYGGRLPTRDEFQAKFRRST